MPPGLHPARVDVMPVMCVPAGKCAQVDQLLAVQFREDMVRLVDHVGRKAPRRQTILVSATLNDKVPGALLLRLIEWHTDPASHRLHSRSLYRRCTLPSPFAPGRHAPSLAKL